METVKVKINLKDMETHKVLELVCSNSQLQKKLEREPLNVVHSTTISEAKMIVNSICEANGFEAKISA